MLIQNVKKSQIKPSILSLLGIWLFSSFLSESPVKIGKAKWREQKNIRRRTDKIMVDLRKGD